MTSSITLDRIVNKAKRVFNKAAYASSFLTTILSSACDVPNQVFPEDGEEEYSESVEGERESITEGESEREMYEGEREGEEGIEEVIESEVEEFIEEGLEECIESEGEGESNGVITFQRTFGGFGDDRAYGVQQTTDGYILGGITNSFGAGNADMYLLKTDVAGNFVWDRSFGGFRDDWSFSIQLARDGGFALAGFTESLDDEGYSMYLLKTDINGDIEWQKTFGGPFDEIAYSIIQTDNGGFVLAGYTSSFGAGGNDMYLVRTDENGNELWSKTFGGSDNERAYSIQQTHDGGYILAGRTNSFGAGGNDMYLVRTDENGNELWSKTFGGSDNERARSILQTDNGGFVLAGYTSSFGTGGNDMYLVRTDENGNELWSKTFGGFGDDRAYGAQQTTDNGFILTGVTHSFGAGNADMYLLKTDAEGNFVWDRTFGGFAWDLASSVQQISDGSYILAGRTESFGTGGHDIYLVKTDPNGNSPNPPE